MVFVGLFYWKVRRLWKNLNTSQSPPCISIFSSWSHECKILGSFLELELKNKSDNPEAHLWYRLELLNVSYCSCHCTINLCNITKITNSSDAMFIWLLYFKRYPLKICVPIIFLASFVEVWCLQLFSFLQYSIMIQKMHIILILFNPQFLFIYLFFNKLGIHYISPSTSVSVDVGYFFNISAQ